MATLLQRQHHEQKQVEFYKHVLALLSSLTAEEKEKIRKRSYYHSFHFYKIVLDDDPTTGQKLRLHYWRKKKGYVQNPHDHGWSFTSYIVRGTLRDTTYVECKDTEQPKGTLGGGGGEYSKYIMDLTTTEDRYYSHFDKFVDLRPIKCTRFWEGDAYYHDDTSIHTSYPESDGTLTMLIQNKQSKNNNAIYVPRRNGEYQSVKHHRTPTMKQLEMCLEETRKSVAQHLTPKQRIRSKL